MIENTVLSPLFSFISHLSCLMTKPAKWHVHPAKTQISLGISICPVWSESLLSAWRKLGSLATLWAHNEDSDQTGWMPRLIWVFAGHTVILLVLSWGGLFLLQYQIKRQEQEKENLSKQIDWLNKEVNDKTKELMSLRREKVNISFSQLSHSFNNPKARNSYIDRYMYAYGYDYRKYQNSVIDRRCILKCRWVCSVPFLLNLGPK